MLISKRKHRKHIEDRIHRISYILVLIFVYIIFAFSTNNPDYNVYRNWYIRTGNFGLMDRFEIGFSLLMLLGNIMGLNYQQFIMVVAAIGLLLIGVSLQDYCKYPTIALILYTLYPLLFDIVQIRNFLAGAVIFFALRYLKKFDRKNVILYLLFLLLACSFHITSVFYILYMAAYFKDYKKVLKIVGISFLIMLFGYVAFHTIILKIVGLFGDIGYIEAGSSIKKVLGYGLFSILAIVMMYVYHFDRYKINRNNNGYIDKVIPILLFCCLAISITSQAYRFFRNMSLIVYIVFLNNGVQIYKRKMKINYICMLNSFFAFLFSAFFFMRQISPWSPMYERLTKTILESNLFFGGR